LGVGKAAFVEWVQSLKPGQSKWHWHAMEFVVEAGRDELDIETGPLLRCLRVLQEWSPQQERDPQRDHQRLRELILQACMRVGTETLHLDGVEGYRQFDKRVAVLLLVINGSTRLNDPNDPPGFRFWNGHPTEDAAYFVRIAGREGIVCSLYFVSMSNCSCLDAAFATLYAKAVERMLCHHVQLLEEALQQGLEQFHLCPETIPEDEFLLLKEGERMRELCAEARLLRDEEQDEDEEEAGE
jgi:hypothetical protein